MKTSCTVKYQYYQENQKELFSFRELLIQSKYKELIHFSLSAININPIQQFFWYFFWYFIPNIPKTLKMKILLRYKYEVGCVKLCKTLHMKVLNEFIKKRK